MKVPLRLFDRFAYPTCSTSEDRARLFRNGFKSSVLHETPAWIQKFAALVLEFIEMERQTLPGVLVRRHNYSMDAAVSEADGLHSNRKQHLAITIDKVRRAMMAFNGSVMTMCDQLKLVIRKTRITDPPLRLLAPHEVCTLIAHLYCACIAHFVCGMGADCQHVLGR